MIVASQTPQAGVVAYDKLTGELKWKSPALSGGAGYVSPSIVKVGGDDHLVMIMASKGFGRNASGGSVNGLDPLTGKVLWTYGNWQCGIPVPHAVDAGEGRVLITGGYSAGAAMIKVQKTADGTYGVTELFKNLDFGAHTQPPILYKDHFYVQYTINERSDGLVCMTMDGQVKWKTGDEPPFNKGGAVLADGLLLGDRRQHDAVSDRARPVRLQAAGQRRGARAGRELGAHRARRRQAAHPRPEAAEVPGRRPARQVGPHARHTPYRAAHPRGHGLVGAWPLKTGRCGAARRSAT